MPIVPPAPARTSDSITIDLATRRGDAPSAIRSAISRRRCTTMQASTAHTPPAACDQPPNREERDEQHGESISGHQLSPACRVTLRRILVVSSTSTPFEAVAV
jgi:hypothetical protein